MCSLEAFNLQGGGGGGQLSSFLENDREPAETWNVLTSSVGGQRALKTLEQMYHPFFYTFSFACITKQ